nr:hypothetical protein [Tanacetum cinerariifolium]
MCIRLATFCSGSAALMALIMSVHKLLADQAKKLQKLEKQYGQSLDDNTRNPILPKSVGFSTKAKTNAREASSTSGTGIASENLDDPAQWDLHEEGKFVSTYVLKIKGYLDQMEHHGYPMPLEKGIPKKDMAILAIRQGQIQKPKSQARVKRKSKRKSELAYTAKQKISLPAKKDHPAKDVVCHHYQQLGHWRRNCPLYLAELKKSKASRQIMVLGEDYGIFQCDKIYLAIRSNLLTREPLPLVKIAFGIISGEESHRNVTSVGTTKPAATAFAAKTFDNNQRRFNNNNLKGSSSNSSSNNKGPNPNLKCTNCNKIRHTMDRCFKLVGCPANNSSVDVHSNGVSSNNATTNNFTVSLSSKQLARLMNLLNDNGVSIANANMVGFKGKQDYRDRLGHLADQVFDALKTTLNLDIHSTSDHLCDTCNKAKQTRKPFSLSDHKSTKIDGYSRAVWVYMLKEKDDVYDSITVFNSDVIKDLNHKNFFDNETTKRPNDEGIVSFNDDGTELSPNIQCNDDFEATSMDENNNTHPEGTIQNETDFVNDFY